MTNMPKKRSKNPLKQKNANNITLSALNILKSID